MSKRRRKSNDLFHLGMGEWTESSDSDSDHQSHGARVPLAPVAGGCCKKKLRLSLPKEGKRGKENSERFAFLDDSSAEQLGSRYVPKNTVCSTKWCISTFEAWREGRNARFPMPNDQVPVNLLEAKDITALSKWLSYFVAEVRKKDGTAYPPKTVYLLLTGLLRHMRTLNPDCPNFLDTNDQRFATFRSALDNVLRELRAQGMGATSRQTEAFSREEESMLWESGVLGIDNPKKLLRTVFYMNGRNFCLRGGEEQRLLKISQLQRFTDPPRYVYTESASKNRHGGLAQLHVKNKVVPVIAVPEAGLRCHVRILDEYLRRLPEEAMEKDNFYVQPRSVSGDDSIWFTANPIGKNTLAKIVKEMCEEGNIKGRKTNHSLRATGVSDLFQAGVPEKLIQERSGHMSIDGLRQYQRTTLGQEEAVSKVLTTGSTYNQHLSLQQTRFAPQHITPAPQMSFSGCSVTIYNSPAPSLPQPSASSCSSVLNAEYHEAVADPRQ